MTNLPGLDTGAFLNFTIDPANTAEVFKIQQSLMTAPRRAEMIQWVNKACVENKDFITLYNEKYNPRFPTNDELFACPEGSLGRELGKHLLANNIQLDFAGLDTSVFYQTEISPIAYLGARGIRTHDVYHAVLGLSTTPLDEYRLLSFQLAQFASPYHMTLIASGYLHTAFSTPEDIPEFLESMSRYHRLGKSAEFFPGFPFELHWATPLAKVREMLKVAV